MQKLFDEVGSLDKRCYEQFGLSEDILMEHAANGMATYIRSNFAKNSKVIVVCGSGNNGADGIALARLLNGDYQASIYYAKKPKSQMALLQQKRAEAIGVQECFEIEVSDVLIDAIVGTGFCGEFSLELKGLVQKMNDSDAFKMACDVPSVGFLADVTLTMGALKKSMFLDEAKEFVGEIIVLDLGVTRDIYETATNWHLLDLEDLQLPNRSKKNTHKGSFGHLTLACGDKSGASILSAKAALRFGSGLVTLMGYENEQIPHSIMYSHELPHNTTALAIGMGLGNEFSEKELDKFLNNSLPLVADADIFHMAIVKKILKRKDVVLTPHAKEFVALLKRANLADISVKELQKNRFKYVELFTKAYPNITLILKGANVIIAQSEEYFINPHGTSALAKGGSGDVLSGLIGALLAQGYEPLQAAKNASLAHTKLAQSYKGADFSLTPDDLIDEIGKL
ncbi:carbohydrate kinase, YjeF related protein [Sulfurimonas gotlandica GD1]|uniref:ADP-dependent (S)-NAD(P)H-hydrate dehydratase n=1 Tax=Sulfurimonas gotlandica (strain DSM 19862 / JCM 16533 / GD1) TaxID=929558 RepID=B6BGA8_SULGG|nr:bifunctional ADP-dependent NAD(P)H-hydrate dehydratase/NAD(P)H-hydrate epimerase [Sulfurimonas gotlandica]EDZ63233.1 Carbohydrate kinase family [Sulfurimonas gotlandica GD1]EHP29534.1 carbohydrate kinase, YjeF related protein [Sulfurimonas gotlandica GD1]